MGGRYTLLLACASDRLNAAVDCWGGFIDRYARGALDARAPDAAARARRAADCPLLAAIGAEDQNPSPQTGERLLEQASASGQEVEVDVYEGAGHAFFADYRPS